MLGDKLGDKLTENQKLIVTELRMNHSISLAQLSKKIGLPGIWAKKRPLHEFKEKKYPNHSYNYYAHFNLHRCLTNKLKESKQISLRTKKQNKS